MDGCSMDVLLQTVYHSKFNAWCLHTTITAFKKPSLLPWINHNESRFKTAILLVKTQRIDHTEV